MDMNMLPRWWAAFTAAWQTMPPAQTLARVVASGVDAWVPEHEVDLAETVPSEAVTVALDCEIALLDASGLFDAEGYLAHNPDVAKAGADRVAKEEKSRARLKNGELGLDFYGLRAKLTELGVQYVDE